jgi:hypothetical protein
MAVDPRTDALSLWSALKAEYERYVETVRVLPIDLLKVQEDMRRFLCLRCAGFLEQLCFVVLRGHIEQKSYGSVQSYARARFSKTPNLTVDAFSRLIGQFGDGHTHSFEKFLTPLLKDSLHELMSIRNDVAHGKSYNGQRLNPERYLSLCEEIYDWMVAEFLAGTTVVLDESGRSAVGYEQSSSVGLASSS